MRRWTLVACALVAALAWGGIAQAGVKRQHVDRHRCDRLPRGAVLATPDTLYMGFGFEGITDAATRNEVIGRAMDYLRP